MNLTYLFGLWMLWIVWGAVSWLFLRTVLVQGKVKVRFHYHVHWGFVCVGLLASHDNQRLYVHPIPWLLITITITNS